MEQGTVDTAVSLGTLEQDAASVIERWVVGGLDQEIVALTVTTEALRCLGPKATRRALEWVVAHEFGLPGYALDVPITEPPADEAA